MQVAGAEVLVRETIRSLGPAIQPTIFCLDSIGSMGEELIAAGVDVVSLDRRPGLDFRVSRRMAAAARDRQIDVIHAHQYTPFFYAALAKPLLWPTMPKLILTEHGRHFPSVVSPKRRAFNRLILDRCADAVNACCLFSARDLSRVDGFSGARIEIIENGIEVDRYGPTLDMPAHKLKMGLDPRRRYIAHVARHHPEKDQTTLIRAYSAISAEFPDVDLLLVGDGQLRHELEGLTRTLNVVERVHFVGIRKDVPDWLRAADIYALTSIIEAASLTLMEAMVTGLPSVVSNVGGNPELVRDNIEGLHFERGDAVGCAAAFRRLLADPTLSHRLGSAARSRAIARYRLGDTVSAYYRLYCKLTGF